MMNDKQQLRSSLRKQRAQLSTVFIQEHSQQILQQITTHALLESYQHIACYLPFDGEIQTQAIIQFIWQSHKKCYLPILCPVTPGHLVFCHYQPHDILTKNRFGILEPEYIESTLIQPKELDVVLMPLLAFDKHGHRLGMGKGYYDKSFAYKTKNPSASPKLIGLAYDFQLVEKIITDQWDVNLDAVVTPSNCFFFD